MSNLVVHTTHQLQQNTDFTNKFLDSLLEAYCDKRFLPNTVIENISLPTLNDLILDANPEYYQKSVGLYGHRSSTHVKQIFEAHLEDVLEHSLQHKLSILFIRTANISPVLTYQKNSSFLEEEVKFLSSNSLRKLRVTFISNILSLLQRRVAYKITEAEISNLFAPYPYLFKHSFLCLNFDSSKLVYKPTKESVQSLQDSVQKSNEKFIEDKLGFFDTKNPSLLAIQIAFTLKNSDSNLFHQAVTSEFNNRLLEQATVLINYAYSVVDERKKSIDEIQFKKEQNDREHKRKIAEQEKAHFAQLEEQLRIEKEMQDAELAQYERVQEELRKTKLDDLCKQRESFRAPHWNKEDIEDVEFVSVPMPPLELDPTPKGSPFNLIHALLISGAVAFVCVLIGVK